MSKKENIMRRIRVEKVTVNIGAGESGEKLRKAEILLERLTGQKPVKTIATKTIPAFGIKRGEPIGVKVTLREDKAIKFLKKAFKAIDGLKEDNFDEFGNFSFGIKEYLDLPGTKYDPEIGILGMDICVTLERPGYRVKRRRRARAKIGKSHLITRSEAIKFVQEEFGVKVLKEEA